MSRFLLSSVKQKIKLYFGDYDKGGFLFKQLTVFFQKKVLRRQLALSKLVPLVNCNAISELAPSELFNSIGPQLVEKKLKSEIVTIPALQLYKFNDGLINAKSNCIRLKNKLVFESYNDNEQFNQGFVEWHDNKYAVVKGYPEEQIDNGFFLAGLGSFNWYHWLVEILPKAMFLDDVPTKNILVSEYVAKYPSMLESLELLIGKGYDIIYLDSNVNYRVKELYHMNAISYVPFELGKGNHLRVQDVFMRGDILLAMKEKIISSKKEKVRSISPRKIFLERSRHRVAINQRELSEALVKLGFVSNNSENLTLDEQIELYYNAECIVGTSGAAFTNMIFSTINTKFICFMGERFSGVSCFSNLANIFGIKLTYVLYELEEDKSHASNEFKIDVDQVVNLTKTVLSRSN